MENPKLYKGIEYVLLEELPEEQQVRIRESLNHELFVKILVHGKLYQHCILYKDYSFWFKSVYKVNLSAQQERTRSVNNVPPILHAAQEKG